MRSDLRPQEAERPRKDRQPVEQDGQADDHDQRAADDLDLPPVLEDGPGEAGGIVDAQREQDERDAKADRIGDQEHDDLRADRDRGQREDGPERRTDTRRPADREHGPESERAYGTARRRATERLLAELRLPGLPRPAQDRDANDAHEVEAKDDQDDATDLAQQGQVVAQRS